MDTLQISFFGPFLYALKASQVEIYAPKCPGHTAGIFTAKNESPLRGLHRHGNTRCYRLGGPVFAPPVPLPYPKIYDPNQTILDASKVASPALDKAHFCLVAPPPQTIVPMNATEVQVVDESVAPPTSTFAKRATGLRFFYNADLSQVMTLSVDGSTSAPLQFDFDARNLNVDFDDVYVRYASTTADDPDHEDAMQCFDLIAELGGVNWWTCYDNPQKPTGASSFVRAGNDCRAAILLTK